MAELLAFINGKTPKEATIALANNPYNCKMSKHPDPNDHRYVIRYNLASKTPTDFSHVISRQCRGPVLLHDPSTNQWQMLAYAFDKFFNEGDHNNQHLPIDATSLRFQEKIDGSLIKLYWYDVHQKWVFATNNTICATLATLEPSKYNTFMDLIDEIKHVVPLKILDKTKTYIFELVSPYNIIVVEHTNIELVHLGTRCNITFEEQEIDIGVKKPKLYDVNSIDDFRKLIATFDGKKFEGGVIVDSKFIRRKIKNADYLQFHYTKSVNDTIPVEELAVISLLKYEKDEFVATYPDHADFINELNDLLERYISEIEKVQQELDEINCKNRAEYAKIAKTSPCPSIHFSLLSKKLKIGDTTTTNIRDYIFYLPDDFDMRKQKAKNLLQTIENYKSVKPN